MGITDQALEILSRASNPQVTRLKGDIPDVSWIRQALFVPQIEDGELRKREGGSASAKVRRNSRTYSPYSLNFADTSLGGNRSINPKPQFCPTADPPMPSLLSKRVAEGSSTVTGNTSLGMGQAYAEIFDSNAERVYFQFGIPVNNSLSNFYSGFFDTDHAQLAETGQVQNLFYKMGKWLGYITLFPVIAALSVYRYMYKVYRTLSDAPLTKYYYMKPTMSLYFSSMTNIVNSMVVNLGFIGDAEENSGSISDESLQMDIEDMQKTLPGILRGNKVGIDIRAVASRYQRLSNAHSERLTRLLDSATDSTDAENIIRGYLDTAFYSSDLNVPGKELGDDLEGYKNSEYGRGSRLKTADYGINDDNVVAAVKDASREKADKSFWSGIKDHFSEIADITKAELSEGSAFISFVVDYDPSVSESVTNNTKPSSFAEMINQKASSAREANFNIADGNLSDNPIINILEGGLSLAKSTVKGLAASLGLSGLEVLTGAANIDMPEFWDSSDVDMGTYTYKIPLRPLYGHRYSILTTQLIPLAAILAGAFNRSTGRDSYTSPYLCKMWHKGRARVELGMITRVSIERAVSNIGRSVDGIPLGIDVSVTVTNLSKMTHIPISTEVSLADKFGLGILDEDNNFTDYMAVLTGLGVLEQFHIMKKLRLRALKSSLRWESNLTKSSIIQRAVDSPIGEVLSVIAKDAMVID